MCHQTRSMDAMAMFRRSADHSVDYDNDRAIEMSRSLSYSNAPAGRGFITTRDSFVEHSNNTSIALLSQFQYSDLSALFDMNLRSNLTIMPKLLQYVRSVFMEIVKANYWYDIQRGVLPRLSYAATYLLYTVDVGLDKIEEDCEFGTVDCRVLYETVCRMPFYLRAWAHFDQVNRFKLVGLSGYFLAKNEARIEKRNVYMLTSFIAAHELAQNKLHEFLMLDTIGRNDEWMDG